MKATFVAAVAAAAAAAFVALWLQEDLDSPSIVAPSSDTLASDDLVGPAALAVVDEQAADRVSTSASAPEVVDELVEEEPESVADDGALLVRVEDQAGHELGGVPVAVWERDLNSGQIYLEATTEAGTGIASIEAAKSRLKRRSEWGPSNRFEVGLNVPGLDLGRTLLDPLSLPEDPVLLTMPDYGSLEVHVVDTDGAPVTAHHRLYITPIFPHPSRPGRFQRGERHSTSISDRASATLQYVPVSSDLRIEVYSEGVLAGVHKHIERLRVGEHRVVKLVIAEKLPHVTGRVVLADGASVSAQSLEVAFTPSGNERVQLADDGRFVLPLDRLRSEPDGRFSAVVSVRVSKPGGNRASRELISGRFDAVVPSPDQPTDVGTIILRSAPVFAAGRVVNAQGEPLEEAWVSIYEKLNRRKDPEDFGWNYAGVDHAYTDADGRFTVMVDLPPGEYAIRAHRRGYIDRGAVRFQSGSGELLLTLDQERHLRGRLELPEGVDPTQFTLVAEVPEATREERTYASFECRVNANAEFHLSGLRPESVDLTLFHGSVNLAIAGKKGITPSIDSSEAADGVNPWDIRDRVAHVAFDIALADASPADRALVVYGGNALPVDRGSVDSLVARSESDEVVVIAPGHQPTTLSVQSLPKEVRLVRGIPVRVAIGAALPAAPEGATVSLTLMAKDPEWLPGERDAGGELPNFHRRRTLWTEEVPVLTGETEWTVHVAGPGTYCPVWHVRHPSEDVVLSGFNERSFYTESGRYEIVLENSSSSAMRWVVQPSLEEALEAMQPDD